MSDHVNRKQPKRHIWTQPPRDPPAVMCGRGFDPYDVPVRWQFWWTHRNNVSVYCPRCVEVAKNNITDLERNP